VVPIAVYLLIHFGHLKNPSDKGSGSGAGADHPSGSSGAGAEGGTRESGTAGGSSYNIFSPSDNTAKGALNQWKIKKDFPLNVVAVHQRDWKAYQGKKVKITYKGKSAEFIVLDYCADKDCSPKGCCTKNAKMGHPKPFLLDMDSRAVTKTWGIEKPEDTFLFPVQYEFTGESLDRAAIKRLGAKWDG